MSNVIAVHAVGNLDTWLGEDNRPGLFKQFCTSYRLYRLPNQAKVGVVWENVDMAKLQRVLDAAKPPRSRPRRRRTRSSTQWASGS